MYMGSAAQSTPMRSPLFLALQALREILASLEEWRATRRYGGARASFGFTSSASQKEIARRCGVRAASAK